ncbi:4Fe-4S binding protein [Rhodospirillaceae bacterium SYSU D60014]|uniref:4Fe-4S binding protein n=1 Tax=Virgifigura deserti TaxID=2268457 RepID=UPI000E66E2DC
MEFNGRRVLVCNCERTMTLDGKGLAKACGSAGSAEPSRQLCRAEIDRFRDALAEGRPLLVACTQEAPLFDEIAQDTAPDATITYTNIRERAGWSDEGAKALPKMAALLAEAALDMPDTTSVTMRSEGTCLIYGRDETAIEAARQLAGRLDVTVLLSQPEDILPPRVMDVPIFTGTIAAAKGHLGAFEIVVNGYAPLVVSSRRSIAFEAPRDGAASQCDLILDLTGGAPLFPGGERRDGYFRPDPKNPAAVQRTLFQLADMVGEFEKPRYVTFHAELCAHSRSRKTGCTRCLDVCPTSAIQPAGDTVAIDPFVCGGCGACHSVCPTGAADYALPPATALLDRVRTLLATYAEAGGRRAVLLVHDARGEDTVALMARYGRGLPANVLPFAVNEVTQLGFEFLSTALAYGAAQMVILVGPEKRDELDGLAAQASLAETAMVGLGFGSGRIDVMSEVDPDAIERALYELPAVEPAPAGSFLPMGGKRSLIRLALEHLHSVAPEPVDLLPLPPQAPFGTVKVDTEGCTLCLACVSACPTGALQDNPERPELRFQEDACVQCGLCKATCPEKVIALEPRLNFTPAAREALVVKSEEPFHCIRCGKPFGTKGSIERIVGQLAEKHWMFQDAGAVDRIKMCSDCRVIAQFEARGDPFAGAPRPVTRTTEDYLREREIEEARARVRTDRGNGSVS